MEDPKIHEPQKKLFFMGKPVDDMSKDELIKIVYYLAEEAKAESLFYQERMKLIFSTILR